MLILCPLFVGTILELILSDLVRDRRLVAASIAGAGALLSGVTGDYTLLTGLTTSLDNLISGSSAVIGAVAGGCIFRKTQTRAEGRET